MFTKQLKVLAILANADGEVNDMEIQLMEKIGKANGMSLDEIHEAIESPDKEIDLDDLNEDDKFDLLHDVIQLMKIDSKIYNEEILYCQNIAAKLGFPLEAVMEIYPHVNTRINLSVPREKEALKKKLYEILNR
ncbi:TerB family tellurite resistance protein [Reichenbachiella sp. MALMAid0571]|uniref:TerB family tellurite resistance protein n=1 Tax=Reichenbachiella sp. MALMAid0571 TaxID=3143939 RepID=UPI0032E03FE3